MLLLRLFCLKNMIKNIKRSSLQSLLLQEYTLRQFSNRHSGRALPFRSHDEGGSRISQFILTKLKPISQNFQSFSSDQHQPFEYKTQAASQEI